VTEETLRISRLGAQGDGIADADGKSIFVPFALPGELVTANVGADRTRLLRVIEPSPDRIEPVCRHFGMCGGCSAQHLARDASPRRTYGAPLRNRR
jgi:23S rRNA (uracil1939-C5)-methyltransferase